MQIFYRDVVYGTDMAQMQTRTGSIYVPRLGELVLIKSVTYVVRQVSTVLQEHGEQAVVVHLGVGR
jgi:hypothetical protein